jgi:hypothetical protein
MFGHAVQLDAALGTFVRDPALIVIRVMRFMALTVPMAARDIGLPIPVVGAIVGNREPEDQRFKSSPCNQGITPA